ncbi:diguanylate cyclase (GGDEF)-like protein [Rhodococcus sp. SORGH_AS 301]|nr:diguanylate cyclase (GGDEF)-like protein [Rhodococcus sp. SORGH_AS_0301]
MRRTTLPATAEPDMRSPAARAATDVALLTAAVFIAAIVGIHSRPPGLLASVWVANAVALSVFVRWPRTFTAPAAVAALLALVTADLVSGTDVYAAVAFNVANIVGVLGGTLVIRRRHPEPMTLAGSADFARMCLGIVVAALLSTTVATLSSSRLGPHAPAVEALSWFGSELTSYLLIVPVLLSFRASTPRRRTGPASLRRLITGETAPIALTVLLMLAGLIVQGPLLLALPLPALLWCATRIPIFGTALLTALWSAWTLLFLGRGELQTGGLLGADGQDGASAVLSVALVALGPLLVAAVSLDRMAVQNKLREALEYDSLTGVLSRAAFLRRSQQRLDTLITDSRPVALLMLDLDHFKSINDTLGHAVGDIALVRSAACILGALPDDAIAGRMGGEEFAILLPHADQEDAASIADSIRRDHERLHVLSSRTATVSIGLAWTSYAPQSVSPLLVSADHALYDAKRRGRNTVVAVSLD